MQTEAEAVTVLLTEGGGRVRRRGERSSTTATSNPNTSVMKKYSKLLLAVLAAVSSLCFIIYKYRYDRLYHVMQVLEVFGSPEDGAAAPGRSLSISPGWVGGLGGGVWLYSAYCSGLQCDRVSVLGLVQRPDNTAVAADLQCSLWFEGARQPLPGLVSVATDDMRVSTFTCESKYPEKIPYAVAVYKGKGWQEIFYLNICIASRYFSSEAQNTSPADLKAGGLEVSDKPVCGARLSAGGGHQQGPAGQSGLPQPGGGGRHHALLQRPPGLRDHHCREADEGHECCDVSQHLE